jgi:hypothetical protein
MEPTVDKTFAATSQQTAVDSLESQREFLKTEFDNLRKMVDIHTTSTEKNLEWF